MRKLKKKSRAKTVKMTPNGYLKLKDETLALIANDAGVSPKDLIRFVILHHMTIVQAINESRKLQVQRRIDKAAAKVAA